jgi:hypothetical protein
MRTNEYGSPVMQDISRQRKLAEQLTAQGNEQLSGQMVGNQYVAPSWTQQLAKVLNSVGGAYIGNKADSAEKDYNTSKSQKFAEILAGNKPQQMEGAPTVTTSMPAYEPNQMDRFGSPMQGVERQPVTTSTPNMTQETPEQQMARVQPQVLEYMQQYGNTPEGQYLLAQLGKQDDRAYAQGQKVDDRNYADTREEKLYNRGRADKLSDIDAERKYNDIVRDMQNNFAVSQQDRQFVQQYKLQAQSQNFTARQNDLNRSQQAQLAGSNVAPVAVMGENGTPVYVNRNDAIGKQPYNATAATQGSPAQKITDAKDVLQILKQAAPLINKSTGSGIGSLYDDSAAFFGNTTSGAQNAASLKALEGILVSKMPKMSGPQSDKDVLLYKQMAGQIGDPKLPSEQKKAAMNTINEINSRYAGVPLEALDFGNQAQTPRGGVAQGLPSQDAIAAELARRRGAK